jgi:hypothetical protein
MFRDNTVECAGDWALGAANATTTPSHAEIDRHLRRLATQRAGLDAEEARWLRRADDADCWRALGYVHALEYLEEVFGYAPRTAQEKLRVAKELGNLSALENELEAGNMPYSVVRELTRVATPETEVNWIDKARGRNYRQVEQMLAGRKKGDEPTDEPDPSLIEHNVTWKLDAATRALLRETRRYIEDELGHALDDATFVDVLCRRATDGDRLSCAVGEPDKGESDEGESDESESDEGETDEGETDESESDEIEPNEVGSAGSKCRSAGPGVMIHLTTCRHCKATVQHGAGVPFVLTKKQVEQAECDAVIVDDETGKRATATIPPKTRRLAMERDQYRCRFPGCRSTRNLDAHHLKHRAHGGDHRSNNIATLCRGHHKLDHDGVITVSGDADSVLVFTRNGVEIRGEDIRALNGGTASRTSSASDVGSRYRQVERDTLAKTAIKQAGYKPTIAARAVERATGRVPTDAPLEVLLKEAFRHCD